MGQAPDGDAYNFDGQGWPLVAGAGDFGDGYPSVKKYTTQATKLSQKGDIVLSIRASIGQKVLADGEYCLGRGVAGLRPRSQLDARYLWHWLDSTQQQLTAKAKGATFKQVSRQDIGELPITLPSLEVQRRIARLLDGADGLRAKRRATLALLDSLTSAVFLEMFGDGVMADWPVRCVADLARTDMGSIRTGPFGSQLLHSEFVDEGVMVLGIDNAVANEFALLGQGRFISAAKYRELTRYKVYPGDVLITIMGTLGRCAVVPRDIPPSITSKHLCCITLDQDRCLPGFLHAYFLHHPAATQYLGQTAKGAIMSGLNMAIIKAMPIAVPPIGLQTEFSRRTASLGSLRIKLCESLAKLETLFGSLQHQAFNGELNLG